jgi:sigma-B regulation protein RsbU (phosphoserine phosphatase)
MFLKRALVCKEITSDGYRLLTPAETMGRVNDALVEQQLSQAAFATAVYGVIDTETLEVTIASGGHPAPLLLRGESLCEVPTEGPLLGIFADERWSQTKTTLEPGDRLLLYTDGIEVAFSADLTNAKAQWRDELQRRSGLSAEDLLADFSRHLDNESGSLAPKDDLTLIALEVR